MIARCSSVARATARGLRTVSSRLSRPRTCRLLVIAASSSLPADLTIKSCSSTSTSRNCARVRRRPSRRCSSDRELVGLSRRDQCAHRDRPGPADMWGLEQVDHGETAAAPELRIRSRQEPQRVRLRWLRLRPMDDGRGRRRLTCPFRSPQTNRALMQSRSYGLPSEPEDGAASSAGGAGRQMPHTAGVLPRTRWRGSRGSLIRARHR